MVLYREGKALSREEPEQLKQVERRLERSGRRRERFRSRREWPLSRRGRRHLRHLDQRKLWFRKALYAIWYVLLAALIISTIYHL